MTKKEREKANASHKRWRDANREHLHEYQAKYRALRRELQRAYDRVYYTMHREELRKRQTPYQREYRRARRRLLAEKARQRYAADPKKRKKYLDEWRNKNKARLAAYKAETRHLQKNLPGISRQQLNKIKRAK